MRRLLSAFVLAAALGAAAGPPPAALGHPADGVQDADHDNVQDPPFANDNCAGENGAFNPDQSDVDNDGLGDACDVDDDADGLDDAVDNCPQNANSSQRDSEGDGAGDPCDTDDDNDGVTDQRDNCRFIANADQKDTNGDSVGDPCDPTAPRAAPAPTEPGTAPVSGPPATAATPVAADDGRRPRAVIRGLARRVNAADLGAGLAVGLSCSERCTVTALLRAGRRRVGDGSAALDDAGRTYVFVDLDRRIMRRLKRGRSMRTTLELSVVDSAGNRVRVRRALTIVGGS